MRKATKKPMQVEFMTYEDFDKVLHNLRIQGVVKIEKNKIINLNSVIGKYDSERCGIYIASYVTGGRISEHNMWLCKYEIRTLEGDYEFTEQDVLIKSIKGELFPCKKGIFYATHDINE